MLSHVWSISAVKSLIESVFTPNNMSVMKGNIFPR
jgi:hypothetical protein